MRDDYSDDQGDNLSPDEDEASSYAEDLKSEDASDIDSNFELSPKAGPLASRSRPKLSKKQSSVMDRYPMNPIKRTGSIKKKTPNPKFNFGFSNNDFDYQYKQSANKSQRRRQQQSDQALNQYFMEIIEELMDADRDCVFHNQVTRQEAPTYKDIVKNPICLKDMRNKTKRNEYKNREQFLEDLALMRVNAMLFNGQNSHVTQEAARLEAIAK